MKFTFDNKEYELNKEKLSGFFNDEENPIKDLNEDIILSLLEGKTLDFEKAYYSAACNNCFNGEKLKAYPFLEYHFYLYTKDNKLVISSLDTEEKNTSYVRLEREGKVDNSYIVSIIVCKECNEYSIEVEEFEI